MTSAPVIRMENIHTEFEGTPVHRGIDLAIHTGEKLALVGGSGSGKTTLLRVMLGLTLPSQGHTRIFGREIDRLGPKDQQALRNRCGVLFQGGALFTDLTVYDNIALPLRELRFLDEPTIAELTWMKLHMVGLDERVGRLLPFELSGGMVKRAALARALALEPELLFLDEPTSGLDPVSGDHFVNLINRLHRDLGFTMIMITHDAYSLRKLCDRVAVLADGRLVAVGPLDTVTASNHDFVRHFFAGTDLRPDRAAGGE